ncbi:MAG: argininosuccinate lyase [Omnitrophica WOR_2 bacterium GWF2_43_52]|nr:MAG: argininosuccinate lyase [Omnitrophica WOR_2 bacterium GWA2_44_7]OGX16072.1 MAG: argininosuccinate lyase [Omnitrophica WOR_2 bacterium GWC2_44_8]OGX21412.1 MAG: argininosuccinate lyase [Omnitrophica WOR_2 bacterium GWF2_43_52]OGX57474.1 MAG: argininosuccinate lyase [Omnitrophica WOR_2 bacterium RIFOXYC2_FULL_43_9]HAH21959.1 argininosuccinate lyase [Candidatus Omnitrophota bacterium]
MAKKLWGGRFSKKTNPLVEEFTKSIHYDYKLAECDIFGSLAHVYILEKCGYLTPAEKGKLEEGLDSIRQRLIEGKGKFSIHNKEEDIHTWIQNELYKEVGDLVLKLHTARSRNDQVVFATKLYCKYAIEDLCDGCISKLAIALNTLAKQNKEIIIPGFTHLQHAQPVRLRDYLYAYEEMLRRDYRRLQYIAQNIIITLGAGALAGTPIGVNEYRWGAEAFLKEVKNWKKEFNIEATVNSIDTVSDRDFVIEIISALSILAMHLSRLAEDLIIWATKEFDFIEIDDAYCTGSSLMPQKKNPDALELIRGYAGRLYGNLVSVLTMMKGLPLTYNRDMQLDKEPLFNSFEIVCSELRVLEGLIKTLKFNKKKIEEHLRDESLYATDLVYYLVDKKIPFKEAHTIIGKLIKYSLDNGIEIKNIPEDKLKVFSDKFVKKEIVTLFDPRVSVESKRSINRKARTALERARQE